MVRRLDTLLTRERSKSLRKNPSPAERGLWQIVRRSQIAGVRFHRRATVLGSIPDFWCPSARLAVEIDGRPNEWKAQRDARRDQLYADHGILTLHLSAFTILQRPDEATALLTGAVKERLVKLAGATDS